VRSLDGVDGVELKNRRKEQGLGQRELSKASGVPQQVISAAENGRIRFPRGAARKLEEALYEEDARLYKIALDMNEREDPSY